jgi:predicted RNA-binding protein YlqC (UPF0109 family)
VEKELVEYIVRSLVEKQDEVTVTVVSGEKSIVIELKVAEEDLGKVIGKHGRIAKAIRTLLAAAASQHGKRVSLEILD